MIEPQGREEAATEIETVKTEHTGPGCSRDFYSSLVTVKGAVSDYGERMLISRTSNTEASGR